MKKFVGLVLGLMLVGCGGSGDASLDNPQLNPGGGQSSGLSGQVLSQSGAPLDGVRMILQNRATRQDTEVVSGAGGRFSVQLGSGVYDVGLDLEGDPTTATAFYGPVAVGPGGQRDFVLPQSAGRPVGQVFGTIFTQQGTAAGNRRVDVTPGFIAKSDPVSGSGAAQSTITDAQGRFSADLGSGAEFGLDIDVFDAQGALDEFVDVGKLQKPLYVEFAVEQSEVENLLRANESSLDGQGIAGSVAAQAAIQKFNNSAFQGAQLVLSDGNVPPDTGKNLLKDLTNGTLDDSNFDKLIGLFDRTHMLVSNKGFLWWKHSVNVDPDTGSDWYFRDATGDEYSVLIFNAQGSGAYHWVSYNSSNPSIVRVAFSIL